MMNVEIILNGETRKLSCAPDAVLLDVLRDEAGLKSVKQGCREGVCGSCVVLLDGRPVSSCLTLAGMAHGRTVETVESLGSLKDPHALQRAFVAESAIQCGYCTPGMLLAAKALLDRNPNPNREDIVRALDGNLCRCTGYVKIVRGVERAAELLRAERGGGR